MPVRVQSSVPALATSSPMTRKQAIALAPLASKLLVDEGITQRAAEECPKTTESQYSGRIVCATIIHTLFCIAR